MTNRFKRFKIWLKRQYVKLNYGNILADWLENSANDTKTPQDFQQELREWIEE